MAVPHCSLLAACLTTLICASVGRWTTLDAQQQSKGLILELHTRSGHIRGLLRNGTLPIMGSVREVGYFYTKLGLGTPAREFSVIIDTGSTITYVPCINCAHCGKHQDPAFDPSQSASVQNVACGSHKCDCGSPPCGCNNHKCYYSRSYAEKSSSEGWLIEDVYTFPDGQRGVPFIFGCENKETGEIYKQTADGILGMGNNNIAFQSQLVAGGVMEDVFGLCFGWPTGGAMLLGDVPLPAGLEMVYTPLEQHPYHVHYYNVRLQGISLAGNRLSLPDKVFNTGYGTVLDSGTTFTHLPSGAFRSLVDALVKYTEAKGLKQEKGSDPQYPDICWRTVFKNFDQMDDTFPTLAFVFDGATVSLPPMRYLFLMQPGEFCLGIFDNGKSGALLGGISVRNLLVQYDRRNKRIGFMEVDCDALLPAKAAPAPGTIVRDPTSGIAMPPLPATITEHTGAGAPVVEHAQPASTGQAPQQTEGPTTGTPQPVTGAPVDVPAGGEAGESSGPEDEEEEECCGQQYPLWYLAAVVAMAAVGALGLARLAHSRFPQWDERVIVCVVVVCLVVAALLAEVAVTRQTSLLVVWRLLCWVFGYRGKR